MPLSAQERLESATEVIQIPCGDFTFIARVE